MEFPGNQQKTLRILHHVFPAILLAYFVIAQGFSFCTVPSAHRQRGKITRKPIVMLHAAVLTSYVLEALLLVINSLLGYPKIYLTDSNVYVLFEVLIWTLLSAILVESIDNLAWYPLYGSWIICIVFEIVLFGFEIPGVAPFKHDALDPSQYLCLCLHIIRLALIVLLLLLYFHRHPLSPQEKDEESTALLRPTEYAATKTSGGLITYGSVQTDSQKHVSLENGEFEHPKENWMKQARSQRLQYLGDWVEYVKGFSVFVPLLWPTKQLNVQLSIFGVAVCLITGRIVNLLLPRQVGILIDSLNGTSIDHAVFPGIQLGLLLLYRFLASDNVICGAETILWLHFGQYATGNIKSAAHRKVLTLSRDFHTLKSTEEITKIIDHAATLTWLLRNLFTFLLPCVLDIFIFGIYLSGVFGVYVALLLSTTLVIYIWVSKRFSSKLIGPQSEILTISKREDQLLYQSLSEWDTVSYFNAQTYENKQLSKITEQRLFAGSVSQWIFVRGQFYKDFVLHLGFAIVCALVLYQITHNIQSIGSFAMVALYIVNVYTDFQSFALWSTSFLEDLAELETLRDLFLANPSVHDGSALLRPYEGAVLFSGVTFAFEDEEVILQDFNFSAKAGQRVSIVGDTGAGKTTILRLLMRFHDVQSGKIVIDGQDIRGVTLSSLRSAMGVIPPDPTLFDNTILENVRYARLDASDQEVIEACKEAEIHESILTYADGYHTRVGEFGLKLSDGEKQQIAIARVMLKNPRIILIDEAPIPADRESEVLIQKALQRLTTEKTTFAVAHRLSTIKSSDEVLVIKDSNIVEQGSPAELLEANGEFARIWKGQLMMDTTNVGNATFPQDSLVIDQRRAPALNRHVKDRSGSSFRPEAPEFVPNLQRSTESRSGQKPHPHLGAGHQHDSRDTASHSHSHRGYGGKSQCSPLEHVPSKTYKKGINPAKKSETSTETITANCRAATPTSQYDGSAGPRAKDEKIAPRLNRWQRRRQARSDPNGSTLSSNRADAPKASQNADEKAPKSISRHVSGPERFPQGSNNQPSLDFKPKETYKSNNQQNRRKRHQQCD